MIWTYFSKDPQSSKVSIKCIKQWELGFLTLRLCCDSNKESLLHFDEDGHDSDETYEDKVEWQNIELYFTGTWAVILPNFVV